MANWPPKTRPPPAKTVTGLTKTTTKANKIAPACLSQRRGASHAALFRHCRGIGTINRDCTAGSLLFGQHLGIFRLKADKPFKVGDHHAADGAHLANWNLTRL